MPEGPVLYIVCSVCGASIGTEVIRWEGDQCIKEGRGALVYASSLTGWQMGGVEEGVIASQPKYKNIQ